MTSNILNRLALSLLATAVHATIVHAGPQPTATQDICVGDPTGRDVFSVGELRTSILSQTPFQELNGPEWVLADGRPLLVRTSLSPHLTLETEHGLTIPDIRGRFLRMANNNACASVRGDAVEYDECLAGHDPDGDRLTGEFQSDSFGEHAHGYIDRYMHLHPQRWAPPPAHWSVTEDNAREHSYTTAAAGDAETRPKNIAVNFYLKICNCRTPHCR